jgi:energy-coupling factor transporter ATP-binding protein EcfA2
MKLDSMRIENFKGIAAFEFTPNGENTTVYGDNATGKTTLVDAFTWLLFDKDSQGAKDFNIKTLDAGSGLAIQAIDHSVEATLTTDDGSCVTLQKIYREKYTKKRGSADRVFDGHTTEHFINGVPKSKGEYQAVVAGFASEKMFRMLTSPTFFSEQLTWQERRAMLVQAFGANVTDEMIIENNPDLAPLGEMLARVSIEDLKKVEMATRKKINEELQGIPGRIDEANKAIPEGTSGSPEALAAKAQKLASEVEAVVQRKATALTGGEIATLQTQLAELGTVLIEKRNAYMATTFNDLQARLHASVQRLNELKSAETALDNQLHRNAEQGESCEREIANLRKENAAIVERWTRQSAMKFVPGGACPTCGQDYPAHLIDRQEADFNRTRAAALATITDEGTRNKAAIEERTAKMYALAEEGRSLAAGLEDAKRQVTDQQAIVDTLAEQCKGVPGFEQTPDHAEIVAKQEGLEKQIAAMRADYAPALEAINAEIEAKRQELEAANRAITAYEMARAQRDRVKELQAREKELARHFEASEKNLYLIEQFQRLKIGALEESINTKFSLVRWKMFDEQINGGMTETCVCTVDGVPYSDLNNAAKVQAGLDIIGAMAEHHGFYPPVWVDNRESIVRLPEMQQQVISLVVSEPDKELRVELR